MPRTQVRGEIPDDPTRDGAGTIDTSEQSQELRQLWRLALRSRQPLDEALEWRDLRERAAEYADTRFGWITQQILCDEPVCPATTAFTGEPSGPDIGKRVGSGRRKWLSKLI